MSRQANQDVLQPRPGFYTGRLARGEQRVDDGGADSCVVVARALPILDFGLNLSATDGIEDEAAFLLTEHLHHVPARVHEDEHVSATQTLAHGIGHDAVRSSTVR